MWIIVAAIVVFVIISIVISIKHNERIRVSNIDQGGLRQSYKRFSEHLEAVYQMSLETDTGRSFSYARTFHTSRDTRKLVVGLKLDLQNQPVLFSKLISDQHGKIEGLDVLGVDFNDWSAITKCVSKSMEQIKAQFNFPHEQQETNGIAPNIDLLKLEMEQRFERAVAYAFDNDPRQGTGLEGIQVIGAISNLTRELKKELIQNKERLGLTEEEISGLVDDVAEIVMDRYIKF